MNQEDVLFVLKDGPKTPSEILEVLEPDAMEKRSKARLQGVQEKLRSLQRWGLVEVVDRRNDGVVHSKVWGITSKGMEVVR